MLPAPRTGGCTARPAGTPPRGASGRASPMRSATMKSGAWPCRGSAAAQRDSWRIRGLTCENARCLDRWRVSGRRRSCWSGRSGGELEDPGRRVDLELGEDVALGPGELGALAEGAGGAGESAGRDLLQVAAGLGPGRAAGGLGDPGQEQGEPAQDDVGADPLFLAVVGGPEVDDLLHVPPAALGFQELLVAGRDVLSGQVRVGAAEQVLAVEVLLGLHLG